MNPVQRAAMGAIGIPVGYALVFCVVQLVSVLRHL
jgi:hypothetical protein